MSRYASELRTGMSRDQAWQVISGYLGEQGFKYLDEKGEPVWRKGGVAAIPQFVKAVPSDGAVHLEAWLAQVSLLPGVYSGEQDMEGMWGAAIKSQLKKRVAELEKRLGDGVLSRGKIESPGAAVPQAAATSAPAAWLADPRGRHQLRYWDGVAWTDHVSDDGEASQDPV